MLDAVADFVRVLLLPAHGRPKNTQKSGVTD